VIHEAATMNIVVVTGLSGAGRSTALRALEDLGYYCVDNLPPSAFATALEVCERSRITRVAYGIDVRVKAFLQQTMSELQRLRADERVDCDVLFLDASDHVLLARFSATRRPHPIGSMDREDALGSLAVLDGIQLERERLAPLREYADVVVDTSDLSVHDLRRRVVELFRPRHGRVRQMLTRFVSFGFKYGMPVDADLVFDVRFINNPFFVEHLRSMSGLTEPIQAFVLSQAVTQEFLDHVIRLLSFLIPHYQAEGKSYLTVAIGCTGGRHRSVVLAHRVVALLKQAQPELAIENVDRDLDRGA
jgi:RNase adapter protein RapZ